MLNTIYEPHINQYSIYLLSHDPAIYCILLELNKDIKINWKFFIRIKIIKTVNSSRIPFMINRSRALNFLISGYINTMAISNAQFIF